MHMEEELYSSLQTLMFLNSLWNNKWIRWLRMLNSIKDTQDQKKSFMEIALSALVFISAFLMSVVVKKEHEFKSLFIYDSPVRRSISWSKRSRLQITIRFIANIHKTQWSLTFTDLWIPLSTQNITGARQVTVCVDTNTFFYPHASKTRQ